ncbi:Acyl-CoA dehydrogenase NM domain-like protein [Mycena venus]|uniref:Acyl-CoA dehydrogenase NM domain-like protein n=1 Tax=Mycena venus TaxID=2733690 RepID=A0A8H6XSG3_9AGAR|nr:Acyl-CoA dehydrogenase NM domain-like protein [Mycena venus]
MHKSLELASSALFQTRSESLSWHEQILLSYDRAKAIAALYNLSVDDVLNVSSKYWEFHTDPIHLLDGAAATLLTIHYNLCVGTIAMFPTGKEDVLKRLLSFELSGQYCLTELGHGLDAYHIETTATLLESGEFELNTPCEAAAKFMPPTTPCGIPCIAVVFAHLIVDRMNWGIKPFLVPIHDGRNMCQGIVSRALSPRGGSHPVQHALTYFRRVRLPCTSLLGSMTKPLDVKRAFSYNIFRVVIGTLSMGAFALSSMRIASYVAGQYSMRRKVIDSSTGKSQAIIAFSTQRVPVLTAVSQTIVMTAFSTKAHALFISTENMVQKHFIAAIFKATIVQHSTALLTTLADRCGAQGLFAANQISVMHTNIRGAAIAEGDVLGISIRFGIELILGRVWPPTCLNPDHILAKHENSLLAELRNIVARSDHHRSRHIDAMILPRCQELVEAVGHRLAVDAAVESRVDPLIIDLYVASVIKHDSSWYMEHANLSRSTQRQMERESVETLFPDLQDLLGKLDINNYITAPIVSDDMWTGYVRTLPQFTGAAVLDIKSRL